MDDDGFEADAGAVAAPVEAADGVVEVGVDARPDVVWLGEVGR